MEEMNTIFLWIKDSIITEEILIFMLFIPIIATLVNVSRYIIGFKTFGIYAPMTLAFAYVFTGIRFGLLVTIAVVISSLISYSLLKQVRMHYLSRITINYIFITFILLGVLILNELSPWSITTDHHQIATVPPLGIILIAALSDFFVKEYVKKDFLTTIRSLIETIIIGVTGWFLLQSQSLQQFLVQNIWINIPILLLNLFIGQYKELRVKDFFRFKKISNE
jgi:hypothetical protein